MLSLNEVMNTCHNQARKRDGRVGKIEGDTHPCLEVYQCYHPCLEVTILIKGSQLLATIKALLFVT